MKKRFYVKDESSHSGLDVMNYEVLTVDVADIVTEINMSCHVYVDEDEVENIEEYRCESSDSSEMLSQDTYFAVHVNDLPDWFITLVDEYDGNIEDYNENEEQQITEAEIKEIMEKFKGETTENFYEEKVVYLWDGHNHRRFVLESDGYSEFTNYTNEEEFKNLKEIDSENYSTGHYSLKKNDEYTYLVDVSHYQGSLTDIYYSIENEIETVEDALEYLEKNNNETNKKNN